MTTGELCDDGNATDGDGCDNNCTLTACGNGIRTGGEQCDDGNVTNGDGCDNNCTLTACRNGIVTTGEQCDDGNVINGDGCDNNCTLIACGNGIVTTGEQCDDGNATNGDGCENNCTISCGNGIVNSGEACDDGNQIDYDGCSRCRRDYFEVEPNEDGSPSIGGGAVTGNDFSTARANGPFSNSTMIRAAFSPVGDEDVFLFTNPGSVTVTIRFENWNPAIGIEATTCGGGFDPVIEVRDAAGVPLTFDDDSGPDNCARLSFVLAAGASVYVNSMEFGDNNTISSYLLTATYLPVP